MTKIYSPSSTTTFARCPQMWQFYREGWQPKHIGRLEMAAAAGIGFAKAMEVYFNPIVDLDQPPILMRAIIASHNAAREFIDARLAVGGIMGNDESSYVRLLDRLTKAVTKFASKWSFPPDWYSFIPELSFPQHGNARADLLCQTDLGPCIVDFKTKVTRPQPYALSSFISSIEYSWQLYHYIWAAREMGIEVTSFAVCVVSFEPWQVDLEQWVVDESYLKEWIESAYSWWFQMELTESCGVYPMAPDHSDKFGLCRFSETCLNGERPHPSEWGRSMIQVKRNQV